MFFLKSRQYSKQQLAFGNDTDVSSHTKMCDLSALTERLRSILPGLESDLWMKHSLYKPKDPSSNYRNPQ